MEEQQGNFALPKTRTAQEVLLGLLSDVREAGKSGRGILGRALRHGWADKLIQAFQRIAQKLNNCISLRSYIIPDGGDVSAWAPGRRYLLVFGASRR